MQGRILGISGIASFEQFIDRRHAEVVKAAYPEVDMQRLPFADEEFDAVISDQVIAHLEDPRRALSEAFRVLKKDGLLAMCPPGLDVLQLASWGNRLAMGLMLVRDGFFASCKFPRGRESGGGWQRTTKTRTRSTYGSWRASCGE